LKSLLDRSNASIIGECSSLGSGQTLRTNTILIILVRDRPSTGCSSLQVIELEVDRGGCFFASLGRKKGSICFDRLTGGIFAVGEVLMIS
jgi:hypothetical protein